MRKFLIIPFFLLSLISCVQDRSSSGVDANARFVWDDSSGSGRQTYLVFRKDFELDNHFSGHIHLFAWSRYHLKVNGVFVNFGPVRSYPSSPEYDTYNITPYLIKGHNFITVEVMNNGVYTYQVQEHNGLFIAWGEAMEGRKRLDLATPGDWKVYRMKGYDPTSPKMTFATGPMESYDARKDPAGIFTPSDAGAYWKNVVVMKDQEQLGSFKARSIPNLTQDECLAESCLGIYSLRNEEDVLSFRVQSSDSTTNAFGSNKIAFAYTWIYSPVKQTVPVGLWWGDFYINGKGPLTEYTTDPDKFYRREYKLELNKGWNYYFVRYGIVWASWDYYMAVPKKAGLIFSPDKDTHSPYAFMAAGPFPGDDEQRARDLKVPFQDPAKVFADFTVQWVPKERSKSAGNPAMEVAWSNFDQSLPYAPSQVGDIEIDGLNPGGTALVFDMGGKKLGRFFIDYEAPEGTIIDMAFSEDMHRGRPWILKRYGIFTATRTIAAGGKAHFETFKPYGLRYVQINIKNDSGSVKIKKTGVISQIYPFKKNGSFTCSDPMMNRIWELGYRTLRVCAEDSYTDTPFRERGLYAGDALPEYAITLAISGDSRLIMRSVSVFADMYSNLMKPGTEEVKNNVNSMGDFPLITLQFYAWAFNRTGDKEFATRYYEGYKNMVDAYLQTRSENGLFKTKGAFIEWTEIDRSATLTTIQSLIIRSLNTMAWVAGKLGKVEDARRFKTEAQSSEDVMQKLCWDENMKAFRDGFKKGKPIDHYYPISSAWPVLFGQTTPEQDSALKKHFINTLTDIGDSDRKRMATPYGSFYVLGALYDIGQEDLAEYFIRKYWSPMILKYDDTAWENFGDGTESEGQGTLSHAWSGSPTYYLSTRVLGVRLGYPGFSDPDSVLIAPQTSTITWARGSVPHPAGIIKVDWKISGDLLLLDYSSPPGVVVIIKPEGMLATKRLILNSRGLFKRIE